MNENTALSVELASKKLIERELIDKVQRLEQCLEDATQEAEMYKEQVDSMKEEHRKLDGEHAMITRALDNAQKLCDGLEREKKRIETEF